MRLKTSDVTLLEEPIAFVVELVDPSASVSGEDAKGENVQVSDPHALYQGVFWQVIDKFRSCWTAGRCTVCSIRRATKTWQSYFQWLLQ